MPVTDGEPFRAVDSALRVQAYRPVAADLLYEADEIDLNTGLPTDLATVLRGMIVDPAWRSVAEQLALLRTRGSGTFRGLYLRVKKDLLCLAVVHGYGPTVVDKQTWRSDFDFTWDVLKSVEQYLGRYKVNSEWSPAIREAVSKYGDARGSEVAAALSLITSAIELSEAARGPEAIFLGVAEGGLADDLIRDLNWGKFYPKKSFWEAIPNLFGVGWSPNNNVLSGGESPNGAIDRPALQRSLTHAAAAALARARPPELGEAARSQSISSRSLALTSERRGKAHVARAKRLGPVEADASWYQCSECTQRFAASGQSAECPSCRKQLQL